MNTKLIEETIYINYKLYVRDTNKRVFSYGFPYQRIFIYKAAFVGGLRKRLMRQ